jgi:hypothetical protein
MINWQTRINCDIPGCEAYFDVDEYNDESEMENIAEGEYWLIDKHTHICPDCKLRLRPEICKNNSKSVCRQYGDNCTYDDYDITVCEECDNDGGFRV